MFLSIDQLCPIVQQRSQQLGGSIFVCTSGFCAALCVASNNIHFSLRPISSKFAFAVAYSVALVSTHIIREGIVTEAHCINVKIKI